MSIRSIEALQRYLRRLCEEAVPPEDAVLLNRFVTAKDREAFELLMARHGPMVLGTACRLLKNAHDAEDVFQAVFLSLARLAKSIRNGSALPAWLHKTTCRVAAKFRANRLVPSPASPLERYEPCDPGADLVWREVCQALDEELQRLPERLRSPLLLCYLSGLTRDEAAKRLGWSLGTLKRRLEEGRKELRIRLEKRGIAAVGLALTVMTPDALQAAVSKSLRDSCLRLIFSTGTLVPATISALVLGPASTMKGLAMKSILVSFAAIAVGVGIYAGIGQTDPPMKAVGKPEERKPAQDEEIVQWDDPLPAGCTMRLGTSRFRHCALSIESMAVSADGKTAFVSNGNLYLIGYTRAIDLVSGRALFTVKHDAAQAIAVSPDGRTFVTKNGLHLHIRDAKTGQELRTFRLPKKNWWCSAESLAFTPDGKAFATISDGKAIHLIDFESGKTIRDFVRDNPESLRDHESGPLAIAFTPDGKRMVSGGFDKDYANYCAQLWDVQTGNKIRRFMHGQHRSAIRSLAFSPDAKTLSTLAEDSRLRLFDVDTGEECKVFPKEGDGVSVGSVAFAPDGKTVAAACNSIRLFDTTTGEERLRINQKALRLHFTDDGKTLTGAVRGAIYRWDTATGKALTPELVGDSIVGHILVTSDGRRIVTDGWSGDTHVWDGATGKHLRSLDTSRAMLALSPDGRYLAWPVHEDIPDPQSPNQSVSGLRIRLFDLAANRFLEGFSTAKGWHEQDLMFTSGGKTLVTVDKTRVGYDQSDGMVQLWNVPTGKEQNNFRVVSDVENKRPNVVPNAVKQRFSEIRGAAVSPDGTTLAVAYFEAWSPRKGLPGEPPDAIRLWDIASGKELRELKGNRSLAESMSFSPHGRLLATSGIIWDETSGRRQVSGAIWDLASGKQVVELTDKPVRELTDDPPICAFSCDGRSLAMASCYGTIRIWETATWTERRRFKGHTEGISAMTFLPSGQLLCAGRDTTVLAWDLRPSRAAASVTLERAWNDLATWEAGESFQSAGRFLAAPAETVKLFAERIKPVAAAFDPKRTQRFLADLGSDLFAVREAASQAIRELDLESIPYLEEALNNPRSLEIRLRVKPILEQKQREQRAGLSPDLLRQIRAVMVLEWIGDGTSKNLLKRWAGGPVGGRLTTEASAALKRLETVAKSNR
jgi:RNA polymerase sigma factor (sigma-70 family)